MNKFEDFMQSNTAEVAVTKSLDGKTVKVTGLEDGKFVTVTKEAVEDFKPLVLKTRFWLLHLYDTKVGTSVFEINRLDRSSKYEKGYDHD